MNRQHTRIFIAVGLAGAIAIFFGFGLGRFMTLEAFHASQQDFQSFYADHRMATLGAYFVIYVAVTGLSLPGAAVMTLAGGALFGFFPALILVSFASSLGATLAFLISRYLLRDWVQNRFRDRLKTLNAGIEREGSFYLFTLRLVPIFPFFVINLALGLTPMKTWTFYWVSQIGMLAGTAVYVNAGSRLGQIETVSGILSPPLLFAFALLGIFPLLARKSVPMLRKLLR